MAGINLIDRGHADAGGLIFNTKGDLAVVVEAVPEKAHPGLPCTQDTLRWLNSLGLGQRLSSVHVVHPYKRDDYDKDVPLRDLRVGWRRVRAELATLVPNVKRVLVISGSNLIKKVIMPGVKGAMQEFHGSIFTDEHGLEIVPTFDEIYPHMQKWFHTDVQRWHSLPKPTRPLRHWNNINRMPDTAKKVVIDFETTGLNTSKDKVTVMGVQWGDNDRAYLWGNDRVEAGLKKITAMMSTGTQVWFHNAQFDLGFVGEAFREAAIQYNSVHCTMIRSRTAGELVNGLKHLGAVYTNGPGNFAWHKAGIEHEFSDPAYVAEDIDTTWKLSKLWESLNPPVVQLFEECVVMAAEQTLRGTYVDKERLSTLEADGKIHAATLHAQLVEKYGVDPGQQEELCNVLRARGYPLTQRTADGRTKLTAEILEDNDLLDILEWRRAVKLDSAFVGKMFGLLREDGTLPHHQNMLGAATGRSTMNDFNWQQVAREGPVRNLLVSRYMGGRIYNVDLAQAEVRAGVYISNDEDMGRWASMADAHRVNAAEAFQKAFEEVTEEERQAAKALIFRVMYGGRGITPEQKRVEAYLRSKFRKFFAWMEQVGTFGMANKFITDPWGKTRNLQAIEDYKGKWAVKRAAINSPIQGLASHFALWLTKTVWKMFKQRGMKSLVLFGVHDSILIDGHPAEHEQIMECVAAAFKALGDYIKPQFKIAEWLPLTGDLQFADSWGATKKAEKFTVSTLTA